jgi:hypothetical protein
MATYTIEYYEQVEQYWSREVAADTIEMAHEIFFSMIQGEVPNSEETIDGTLEWKEI